MIAVIYDKIDAVNLLVKYGGIKLYEADNKGAKATDLGLKYKREKIFKTLTKVQNIYPFKEGTDNMVPLNTDGLMPTEATVTETEQGKVHFEEREDLQDLLLHGKRVPCQICQGANGRIKFTRCCGEPVHSVCVDKATKCPFCGQGSLSLGVDIKYPEKALKLD